MRKENGHIGSYGGCFDACLKEGKPDPVKIFVVVDLINEEIINELLMQESVACKSIDLCNDAVESVCCYPCRVPK